ncbi:MAG: hypothetical protein ACQESC_03500 [Nanobdellota archaeon]
MTLEEHIISDVAEKKGKLHVHIFNLGNIYCDWTHEFTTRILDKNKKEKQQLLNDLAIDPILSNTVFFESGMLRKKNGEQIFDSVTLQASPSLSTYLKEKYPDNKYRQSKKQTNKSIFITQGYTDFMREQFANPSTIVTLDATLNHLLSHIKTYNNTQQNIQEDIAKIFSDKNKGYGTTTFRRLDKTYFSISDDKTRDKTLKTQGYTKHLTNTILAKRKEINNTKKTIDDIIQSEHDMRLEVNEKSRKLELHLTSTKRINPLRSMTYDDAMKQKWLFFDIEIPLFRHENPEVSWVGMNYYDRGKLHKEMHTLHDVGTTAFKGYRMHVYHSQQELIDGVARSIQNNNPYFCSAYNGKFDFLKLREGGSFPIGDQQSTPLQTVATPFLERIDVRGREVIDLLRWAQLVYDFLPNKKLELVSRTALPKKSFEKSISYDEMETLELQAKQATSFEEQKRASRIIADYLVGDVDIMPDLFTSDDFQTTLKHNTRLAQDFNVPLSWLFYSPRTLNIAQKREYKKRLGVDMDQVKFLRSGSREQHSQNKQLFREYLTKQANIQSNPGIYSNVHLGYLKYGHKLKHFIYKQFPQAKYLFNKKPTASFENNLFGRFGNALADFLTADFIQLKTDRMNFSKELSDRGINKASFLSIQGLYRYNKQPQKVRSFIDQQFSSFQDFQTIIDKWYSLQKQERQFNAQYSPISKYHDPRDVKSADHYIEQILLGINTSIQQFAKDNGISLLHQQGPYIYFQGDVSQSTTPQAFIQHIPRAIISKELQRTKQNNEGKQRIFYRVDSISKGMKLVDHATFNLALFERNSVGAFLEHCLERDYDKAVSTLELMTLKLNTKQVNKKDLVWYTTGKDRYSAFEKGKKTYFHTHLTPALKKTLDYENKTILFDASRGLDYYVDTIHGNDEKIYFKSINDVEPDFSLYNQRHKNRVLSWAYHLIGPTVLELFNDGVPTLFSQFDSFQATKNLQDKEF